MQSNPYKAFVQFLEKMTELSPDAFYELPASFRNQLLAFWGKAQKVADTSAGFSGEIVFLDNGNGVFSRMTCAKFPRWRQYLSPALCAERFLREIKLQSAAHYHPNVHPIGARSHDWDWLKV